MSSEVMAAMSTQHGTLEIDVEEFDSILRDGGGAIVDVREGWEYRRGRVPGAIPVPLGELPGRLHELPRDTRLLVICEHGNRSLAAASYLRARGFEDAVSIAGGTVAWARSGRPLEGG
jgi:rhodanese-related sulfurtransferase